MAGVLEGIRVVDFGRYIAGPFCATLLGDLGANIMRVERVDVGEEMPVSIDVSIPVDAAGEARDFIGVDEVCQFVVAQDRLAEWCFRSGEVDHDVARLGAVSGTFLRYRLRRKRCVLSSSTASATPG